MKPSCCLHTLPQFFTINLLESEKKTIINLSNSSLNLQVFFWDFFLNLLFSSYFCSVSSLSIQTMVYPDDIHGVQVPRNILLSI